MRELVAPFMDGEVEAGTFFRIRNREPRGHWLLGSLLFGIRRIATERQTGLGAFTYVAVQGPDVGLFELRWSPLKVHRVIGHWSVASLAPQRIDTYAISISLDGRAVELDAAAPGIDASEVIERLTSC